MKSKKLFTLFYKISRITLAAGVLFLLTHTRIENKNTARNLLENPKPLALEQRREYISVLPKVENQKLAVFEKQPPKKDSSDKTADGKFLAEQKSFTNQTKKWVQGNSGLTQMMTVKMPTEEQKKVIAPQIKKMYEDRKKVLNNHCSSRKHEWSNERQMIADPDHLVSVCFVQKAGSTNWIRSVFTSAGKQMLPDYRTQASEDIEKLSSEMIHELTFSSDGTRIITVRHPFSRLVSGWHNKFEKEFIAKHGHNLMLDTMPDLVGYADKFPDDLHYISFKGFVQFILDKGLENLDVHFKSINLLCDPCGFPFDFIVKAETGPAFGWYILDRYDGKLFNFKAHIPNSALDAVGDKIATPPTVEEAIKSLQEIEVIKIREIFKTVPVSHIRKLMQMLEDDFKMFGYGFDIKTLTISI